MDHQWIQIQLPELTFTITFGGQDPSTHICLFLYYFLCLVCIFPPAQCYVLFIKKSLLTWDKTWFLNSSLLWMSQVKHKVSNTLPYNHMAITCSSMLSWDIFLFFSNLNIIFLRDHGLLLLKPCSSEYSLYTRGNWKLPFYD